MARDFADRLTHHSLTGSPEIERNRPPRPRSRNAVARAIHNPNAPRFGLDYHPTVDNTVLVDLERAAREVGLPLHQVELLGQNTGAALGFVHAVARGAEEVYLEAMDWDGLEELLRERPS